MQNRFFLSIWKLSFESNLLNITWTKWSKRIYRYNKKKQNLILRYTDMEISIIINLSYVQRLRSQQNLKLHFADFMPQSSRESYHNNLLYFLMSLRQKRGKATQKRFFITHLLLSIVVSFLAANGEIVYKNMLPWKDVWFVFRAFEKR